MGGEGREGDWECSGCRNRNYAFRSFCNRCKQPRLLVDTQTPADSKWLPRIGDWICTGCTNNNYASREKCKKCGQPKELAAMPAIAMPGASLPTHQHHFARAQGVPEQNMNIGLLSNGVQPVDKYGIQQISAWPLGGNNSSGLPSVPKGWRNGDWICNCGFHNYSSRAQCKQCNASMPPVLGTKRLASEDLVHDWDNKRLNAGQRFGLQFAYPSFDQTAVSGGNQTTGIYPPPSYLSGSSAMAPNVQVNLQFPHVATMPTLLGKGAKHWRDGDWMCTSCDNHNYASRSHCNRCKTQKDAPAQSVSVA
ncbi:Zinc finger, RanBP2-type protein [Actinidia chinensis var. chinensis]|uniref:Zinc finger, RanBP2-type protein n=1 Tax=Actinidia chinensis var. chinensis TaxID=1590841 RepID=A0A2R6R5R9_ACTCC|nr:Zinc finger, RanBP2-type protein [Actinidia chinensis var. chinensis]